MIIRTQAATPSSSTLSQATTSASSSPRGGILLRPHLWNITPWHSNGKHNISKDIARHCACPETRPCTDSGSTEIYFYSTWCQVLHSCQGLASDHADLSQTQYGAHSPWWHNSGLTCHHQAPNPCQPHMCASNPCPQSNGTKRQTPSISLGIIKVPTSITSLYCNLNAWGDVLFVNKVTFFGEISLNIRYGYGEHFMNRHVTTSLKAIWHMRSHYALRGLLLCVINPDPKF